MKKDENRQKRTIKRTARVLAVLTGACLVMLLGGCGKKEKEPVTVTLWHVYGGQTESPLNDLIDEFNETVGKDKNIRVEVGSVTIPSFIFIFTCPKTLYLCGFSPFSIFLLHPFYTLFSTVGVAASNC